MVPHSWGCRRLALTQLASSTGPWYLCRNARIWTALGLHLNYTTHSVPDTTACARCKKIGFVRMERVVRAGHSMRAYYCGSCNYSWQVADDPEGARLGGGVDVPPDRSRSSDAPPRKR